MPAQLRSSKSLHFLWLNETKKLSSKMTNLVKSATCVPHFHSIKFSSYFLARFEKQEFDQNVQRNIFYKTFCGVSLSILGPKIFVFRRQNDYVSTGIPLSEIVSSFANSV